MNFASMKKRKLIIGLASAGVFSAGFGAAVFPASAELGTMTVTLLNGQTVSASADPASTSTTGTDTTATSTSTTPASTTATATTPASTTSTTSTTSTATTPAVTTTATTPASTTAADPAAAVTPAETPVDPAAAAPAPDPAAVPVDPAADPAAVPTVPTATTPAATTVDPNPVVAGPQRDQKSTATALSKAQANVEGSDEAKKDDAQDTKAPTRLADGTPTAADPTFSEALPGPAAIGVPNFFIDKFRIPPFLLPIYQAAGIQYGVRWEILAAINEIETNYGRNLNVSSAGAQGWMQFMPSTWRSYGVDANEDGTKDPDNPVDAIFAAARYLKAAGADKNIREAIYAYNHAGWYVDSVLLRARLIGGMPSDLVGSLTGLTQGHFPVHAKATYADDEVATDTAKAANVVEGQANRRGIDIFAKAGSPAIATQDGKIVAKGYSQRLGNYIKLQDGYGNTYTYGDLGSVARGYPVPKDRTVSSAAVRKELKLPKADPKPTTAASAGKQTDTTAKDAAKTATAATATTPAETGADAKERLFANPARPTAYANGGEEQLLNDELDSGKTTFKSYFSEIYGLDREDVDIKPLKVGSKVIAGTILGRLGKTSETKAAHLRFEIRPAGEGSPRVDPKPILDGWKLLESTSIYRSANKNPFFGPDANRASIGQILLMSKEALQTRVLADPQVDIYSCGRDDIAAGLVDRRVLATVEFLSSSGLRPTISSLQCGHGVMTASGNLSEHSSGDAVDIAAINGIPILGHQGSGSITDITIRRLLTLQGTMKPHQIISLMTFTGADNTLALPDHADHIHVGFRPLYTPGSAAARKLEATLKPSQWIKLIDRLGQIDNPTVATKPSAHAIDAGTETEQEGK